MNKDYLNTYSEGDWDAVFQRQRTRCVHGNYRQEPDGSDVFEPATAPWWALLTYRFKLHPVVRTIMFQHGVRPKDPTKLMMEWPHIAETDFMRLAYTRSASAGMEDKQTLTSVSKYLASHWPHIPAHVLRDWAGSHTTDAYALWDTTETIIRSVEMGPSSCMKSSYGSIQFGSNENRKMQEWLKDPDAEAPEWGLHPYYVYGPELGWRAAVRMGLHDTVVARALVYVGPRKDAEVQGEFVRAYRTADEHSPNDEQLVAWLTTQGYRKVDAWPQGAKLRRVARLSMGRGWLMPYIDGGCQSVTCGGAFFEIDYDGEYSCTCTDGTADEAESNMRECDRCGSEYDADEGSAVGRDHDMEVCPGCIDEYTEVEGRGRHGSVTSYRIPESDAVEVDGNNYDSENLPDYIVGLETGDYVHRDNCEYIDGDYYLDDDERICYAEDVQEHRLRDDCWQDHQGNWQSDDAEVIFWNGHKYTRDDAEALGWVDPATVAATETTETTETTNQGE